MLAHKTLLASSVALSALAAAGATGVSRAADTDTYPTRTIRIIVPYSADSATYAAGFAYSKELSKRFGQPVVLEPRPGFYGANGIRALLGARPDGYTAGLITRSMFLVSDRYDPTKLVLATEISADMIFLVVPYDSPVKTLKDLMASKPHFYAASSPGAIAEGKRFIEASGIDATPVTNYQTDKTAALTDLRANRVQFGFFFNTNTRVAVANKWGRAIAVLSKERSEFLPEVPTIGEALKAAGMQPFEPLEAFTGVVFPPGTPQDIVTRFADAACAVAKDAALRQRFEKLWAHIKCNGPAAFKQLTDPLMHPHK